MKVSCPHCQGNIEVGEEWFGLEANCPHCGEAFRVPSENQEVHRPTIPLAPLQPGPSSRIATNKLSRRRSLVIGLVFLSCLIAGGGILFVTDKIVSSRPVTLRRDETGKWDLSRFSKRPKEEQDYIRQLMETRGSLLIIRSAWTDLERLNTFPDGDYWQGKPASIAQSMLRSMELMLGKFGENMQKLVNDYNELQRVAEPFLAIRPELKETHESFQLDMSVEFEVSNPLARHSFRTMEEGMADMLATLGVAVPEPKD